MRFVLSILFAFCFLHLSAQVYVRDSINRVDSNGKRQGYWVITASTMKLGAPWLPNQKIEEGTYQDSKKNGIWIAYWQNGNKKSEMYFVNNRPNGRATLYFENGHVTETGTWKGTRWIGEYKLYYENDTLRYLFMFDSLGYKHGLQKFWRMNGKLECERNFKHGTEDGWSRCYYDDGSIMSETFYTGGYPVDSLSKQYDSKVYAPRDPEPIRPRVRPDCPPSCIDCECQDGKIVNGKVNVYDKNGLLMRVEVYKNGEYMGDAPLISDEKNK